MLDERLLDQRMRDWGDEPPYRPVIKVMGMGGGGSNAVDRMIDFGLYGVNFIIANILTRRPWPPARRLLRFSLDPSSPAA